MTVRIRPAEEGDIDEIVGLLQSNLGQGPTDRSARYWTWKHHASPFGRSYCLVALDGETIVGLRAFMRWRWQYNHRDIEAVRAVDTATAHEWRGRGVFRELTSTLLQQLALCNVSFVFNTPNKDSKPGYLSMGWREIGSVPAWLRPLRPGRLAVGALRHLVSRRRPLARPEPACAGGRPIGELFEWPYLPELMLNSTDRSDHFQTCRSIDYLRWRYDAVPGITYSAAWAERGDARAALIFRAIQRGGLKELRLCEVIVGSGEDSLTLTSEVLRDVMVESPADYAAAVACAGTPERSVLAACGFVALPIGSPAMTVRPVTADRSAAAPAGLSCWRLAAGDLELF